MAKAHFQALSEDKQLEGGDEWQESDEEAELYANAPDSNPRGYR